MPWYGSASMDHSYQLAALKGKRFALPNSENYDTSASHFRGCWSKAN